MKRFYSILYIIIYFLPFLAYTQNKKENVVTTHSDVIIEGTKITYTATVGYLPIKNIKDSTLAKVFYIYYQKKDEPNKAKRPIMFAYNGGPGSSSVWLHMGALGPRIIDLQEDGTPLRPPYSYSHNSYSWLDLVDLVFIDPMHTGYTVPIDEKTTSNFLGFTNDVKLVSDFIRTFTTQYNRWSSPKFLAGESYGTTRSAGVATYLQEEYGMYLNGVILISAILDFGSDRTDRGNDRPYPLLLPTLAATSWYHGMLPHYKNIDSLLNDVEHFAMNEYYPALHYGDKIPQKLYNTISQKLQHFTGLSKTYINNTHQRLTVGRFNKELLRHQGKTVGRLDSRFIGYDYDNAGERYEYDPSYNIIIYGVFSTAVNDYLTNELKFKQDFPYEILTSKVRPWEYSKNKYLNVAEYLRRAMTHNPHLKVWITHGYYDMATPYFATEDVINHMFLRPDLKKNIISTHYPAGHMMYIHQPSLIQMKKDFRDFIQKTLK